MGKVYIVGAGCGAADLITVRGLKLLESCDAVIYDDLIDQRLLNAAPTAEKIYMGKRSGRHSAPQSQINEAIIRKAGEYGTVVRLKGGDPFVFGRGGEEIEALQKAGIPYEEVPGISSAIAIPAAAGIPVTHRGISRGFHVITAHTADDADGLPEDMDIYAKLHGTLLFLMGLSKLELLCRRLTEGGMSPYTPAAVISGGNSKNPVTVRGSLETICAECRSAGVRPPAVIVVGATAAMDLSSTLPSPLSGVRIALTGTDAITEKLRPLLDTLGANTFVAQRSVVRELDTDTDFSRLLRSPCCVVFTSSNGVRIFFKKLSALNIDLRRLSGCRFAVIGAATAAALKSYGIIAELCPDIYTSEALADTIQREVPQDEPVYLFRSAIGSKILLDKLSQTHTVKDIHTYAMGPDLSASEQARAMLPETDYICFSSASGVELFFEEHKAVPDRAHCVCIGEVCAAAFSKRCSRPYLLASEISAQGMVNAILSHRHSETDKGETR